MAARTSYILPISIPFLEDITMDTIMADADSSSHYGQVQVHFTTNSPDIELPEGKRQLLVPTSMFMNSLNCDLSNISRRAKIWSLPNPQLRVYARHHLAHTIRLLNQRNLFTHYPRRIPHSSWTFLRINTQSAIRSQSYTAVV